MMDRGHDTQSSHPTIWISVAGNSTGTGVNSVSEFWLSLATQRFKQMYDGINRKEASAN